MLRMLILFDVSQCTSDHQNKAAVMENMFRVTWGDHMGRTEFEVVYTCQQISEPSRTYDRMEYAALCRQQTDMREHWGADLMIVVGKFSYERWWRAAGNVCVCVF
jgi:hypothetical protein